MKKSLDCLTDKGIISDFLELDGPSRPAHASVHISGLTKMHLRTTHQHRTTPYRNPVLQAADLSNPSNYGLSEAN